MSRTLEIQVLIYMIIACTITLCIGYVKGHREGVEYGRRMTHRLYRNLRNDKVAR